MFIMPKLFQLQWGDGAARKNFSMNDEKSHSFSSNVNIYFTGPPCSPGNPSSPFPPCRRMKMNKN